MMPVLRPTVAEIDLTKLARNLKKVRAQVGEHVKVLAIVKANAYGHGAVKTAQYIEGHKLAEFFGVASVEEGITLREAGVKTPILVLGSIFPFEAFAYAIRYDLAVTVASLQAAEAVVKMAEQTGKKAYCHVKQDSGMGRIGTRRGGVIKVIEYLHAHDQVVLDGLFTHLCSVPSDMAFAEEQIGYFRDTLTGMNLRGISVPHIHVEASAAIPLRPDAYYTMVRPGHSIYGLEAGYEPVMSLKTRIVYVKDVPAGSSVSYNRSYRAIKPVRVATLPVGYGDGYLRALSGKAEVLIGGVRCPVIGNITMDMMMADISAVPAAAVGDEVVLAGRQGAQEITLTELAEKAGTIDYELCTLVTARVPRIYKE